MVSRATTPNQPLKAIIGLGNPDPPYGGTRHNIGAEVASQACKFLNLEEWKLQKKIQAYIAKDSQFLVGKPNLYMNHSGLAVRAMLDYYKVFPENLFVIFDDLDIAVGSYKIHFARGPKDHNGLLSVYQHLGTQNFWHIRVGVDGRRGEIDARPSDYVLSRFLLSEKATLQQLIPQILAELKRHLLVSSTTNEVS